MLSVRRWIAIMAMIGMLNIVFCLPAFAEEESRLPEILEVLDTIRQNLKEGNYGAASTDFDYVYEIFKEQKGTWLLGCFVKKYKKWVQVGTGSREVVGTAAFGGGTTIKHSYTMGEKVVDAQIMISPVATGLGAILNNPAFRGGGKGKQKRLRNGLTVNIQPKEVSGAAGGALLTWKVNKGQVTPSELESLAGGTIKVGCVKELAGGQ